MQIGKGKSPQAARDWAERNKQIYYRATIAADAYNAGATKEVALRKAFGKKGLREIEAGRAGSPSKMVKNPAKRLPANRLTPVSFTVRGKRHTGKAKRVGNVVKVFVTPGVARKVNPELKEYKVILHRPGADRGVTAAVYATTAGGASREARKRKAEFVPSDPKKWKVFSVTRSTGTR
jgi:hypothetical protein